VEIVTNSRAKARRRCDRLHYYQYVLGVRPVEGADELRFGSLAHLGLEAWWSALGDDRVRGVFIGRIEALAAREQRALDEQELVLLAAVNDADSLAAALAAVAGKAADPYEQARVEEMLRGYHFRWIDADLEPIDVEVEFLAPLVNPATGAASRTFQLAGKLDVLARERSTGRIVIVEHKTSSEDLSAGSVYWQRLRMDGQVSTYFQGARALGYEPAECVYDVLGKPKLTPMKATPLEERKYTLPKYKACPACKKKGSPPAPHDVVLGEDANGPRVHLCEPDPEDATKRRVCTDPGGKLYANLRAEDETPDEYRARLVEAIAMADARGGYFARGEVVRLEHDELEHAADTWQLAIAMRDAAAAGERLVQLGREPMRAHPRNPDACEHYRRMCSFFDVCTGADSIDNQARFERVANVHAELAIAAG
jgi:hypothetical protein